MQRAQKTQNAHGTQSTHGSHSAQPTQNADFPAQMLPVGTRSLVDEVPPAPPGTIFVLAEEGGYAVPPRTYTLLFGRDRDEVHVAVGTEDPYVSRKQGVFTCVGREWWLRNTGACPIELPGAMLLTGHERRMEPGYTPLLIRSSERRSHPIEVRVTDVSPRGGTCQTNAPTKRPQDVYELDLPQRMVLTALAQRYLIQDAYPQPLAWQQVANTLNQAPDNSKIWTAKAVEAKATDVRKFLSREKGVPGLTREEVGEPVGNMLNHNLILELLRTTTLMPQDLRLLGLGD
jgi:hypothetical protein